MGKLDRFSRPNVVRMWVEGDVVGLIKALSYKDIDVQLKAVKTLIKIGEPAVKPLTQALKDRDEDVRGRAAVILGQIGDARAVEHLTQVLKDKDPDVRREAKIALEKIKVRELKKKRDIDGLIRALKHQVEGIRQKAAAALGRIGDKRAVEPLIQTLRDRHSNVRAASAFALALIGDARAVEPLTQALKDKDKDVREIAALALKKIGK